MIRKVCLEILVAMFITLNMSISLAQNLSSKTGGVKEEGEISDVIIEGEAKDKIEIKKQPPEINIEAERLLDSSTEKTEELMQKDIVVPCESDFVAFNQLSSKQVVRPYLPDILTPPLISFYPRLSKGKIKGWELVVTDEQGRVVKAIKGKGIPKTVILWDGKDNKGKMIKVNTIYSYKFIAIDLNDKAHTTLGDSFQVDALMYKEKGKLKIELATKSIYPQNEAAFLKKGKLTIDKLIDILREYSRYPFSVEVLYEGGKEDFELVREKTKILIDYLAKELIMLPRDINSKIKKKDREREEVIIFTIHLR